MKIEAVQQCSLGGTDIENEFIIIGAGGTGGHLIPNLARLISIINNGNDHHRLTIIDGDEVETKNISRQNFIHRDVGKNKAEVLGQRYSSAFGIPIRVIPNYLEDVIELESLINSTQKRPIIIGCVDNNKTRKLIHKVFFKYSNRRDIIWIDSGNEEFTGQVVIGMNYGNNFNILGADMNKSNNYRFFLPPVTSIYPDILEDTDAKFNTELSCADRAVSAPQSISANLTAANIIMNFVNTILTHKEGEGIKTHQVRFNCKNNVINTDLLVSSVLLTFPSVRTEIDKAYRLTI